MKFIPAHVSFIVKSNSENYIKIRCCLTKLHRKINWPLFMAHGLVWILHPLLSFGAVTEWAATVHAWRLYCSCLFIRDDDSNTSLINSNDWNDQELTEVRSHRSNVVSAASWMQPGTVCAIAEGCAVYRVSWNIVNCCKTVRKIIAFEKSTGECS